MNLKVTSPHRGIVLGIGGYLGHDANVALLVDGRLVAAAQEERFTRRKHEGGFPHLAIQSCLDAAGLTPPDVPQVVFAEKPFQATLFDLSGAPGNALSRALGRWLPESFAALYDRPARRLFPAASFHYVWHHLSHVVGAFYTSPFRRAAFLCVDGKGEDYSASAGTICDSDISLSFEQPWENGLGLLYTLVTRHLGFASFGSEYKVMGLAPYGTPRFADALGELFQTDADGGLRLHADVKFANAVMAAAVPLVTAATGIAARAKDEALSSDHVDLAASIQKVFEVEVLKMARFVRRETREEHLIFCGGCAQNCVAAGLLRREKVFPSLFNSPVGGDMGSGLGAALLLARKQAYGAPISIEARGFMLGSEPGPPPADAAPWRVDYGGDLHEFIAGQIAEGKIIGWVRGGMELGARALGARSILADPRELAMQSTLNLKVKFRESFRPFAPAILAERVGDWFDSSEESDYMNYVANLRPEMRNPMPAEFASLKEKLNFPRCKIPSVVHVDFSARLQTVRREVHPDFHRLIGAFEALTGVPIVINTSFNVSGQPIVRTAAEAWECFLNTDIDLLVLNDDVFRNPFQRTRDEKLQWLKQFEKSA